MFDKQSNGGPGLNPEGIVRLSGSGVKKKLKVHTIETKFQAVTEVEKGIESKASIAKKYEIPSNTLETWLKNADKIKDSYKKRAVGPQRKKCVLPPIKTQRRPHCSGSNLPEIETCLYLALCCKARLRSSLLG